MVRRIALENRQRSKDYFIWLHSCIAIISLVPRRGLLLHAPTIIKSFGFSTINANLLAAVSNFGLIFLSLVAARVSDWVQLRGPVCIVCTIYALWLAGAQYSLVLSTDKCAKYAIFTVFMAGNATFQGVNGTWLSSNVREPKALAAGQALVVMAANLGGLAGQQLFQDDDAPKYTRGFLGKCGSTVEL